MLFVSLLAYGQHPTANEQRTTYQRTHYTRAYTSVKQVSLNSRLLKAENPSFYIPDAEGMFILDLTFSSAPHSIDKNGGKLCDSGWKIKDISMKKDTPECVGISPE